METSVVNTESEVNQSKTKGVDTIMEDQTTNTPQPTSYPVEELKKDLRLRDPRLRLKNNPTDLKKQMPSSSTTAASSKNIFTKDEPKYKIFDDEPISEYMLHEFGSVLNDIGAKPVDTEGNPVNVPLVNPDNEIDHDIEDETPLTKRLRNQSKYKVSLYYKKNVEVMDLLKPIELTISNRLFALDGDVHSVVFETEDGMKVRRVVMETMIPNTWIVVDLLNVWTTILNYEEGLKTKVNAKKVYFNVIVLEEFCFAKNANLDKLYKIFEDKANETLKMRKIKSLKKLIWYELLHTYEHYLYTQKIILYKFMFFLIFHHDHYYIYVFYLKTNIVHLFDNRKDFPAEGYNKFLAERSIQVQKSFPNNR
ncbi:hypothetical protein LXL04_015877 [Taraxacum kok-saghyz]